jgi:hypothetical protein
VYIPAAHDFSCCHKLVGIPGIQDGKIAHAVRASVSYYGGNIGNSTAVISQNCS